MARRKGLGGWLTRKDIDLLEKASKKPEREKNYVQKYRCFDCSYEWFYSASRCPICSSQKTEKA